MAEISVSNADIVCVQEVNKYISYSKALSDLNYVFITHFDFQNQDLQNNFSEGIAYKKNKFELLDTHRFMMSEVKQFYP